MKFTIEDVQVAIKGVAKYGNHIYLKNCLPSLLATTPKATTLLRCICNRCMKTRTSTL